MVQQMFSNLVHKGRVIVASLTIVLLLLILIAGSSLSAIFVHADSINGVGVGIYWDQSCTNKTRSLEWGSITPGTNTTLTAYVRNERNSEVNLWLSTSNWTPSSASAFISLSWNYTGQALNIDQVIPVELTLYVSPIITGVENFQFTTTITTTG